MKLASLLSLLTAAAFVVSLHADVPSQPSQAGKDGTPEVNVVLRISRKFIAELTTKKLQRTDPVYLCILDSPIVGTARTDATFTVQFDTNTKESSFLLQLKGKTDSETVAEKTLLQVFGSGQMDFTVRKRVIFDGKKFRAQPTNVDANFCSSIDGIATPGGLLGWIIQLFAAPEIRRRQPIVAEIAFADGKAKLTDAFDQETTKLLDQLNQVSPLQETVEALFPETRDWLFYLSTTPTHLIVGVGPRDHRVPDLPAAKQTEAPIELWIRGQKETKGMLQVLKIWKDAGKQLESLLPPELAKNIDTKEGIKTGFVKEWFVIRLGAPAQKARPEESVAGPTPVVWRPIGDSANWRAADVRPPVPPSDNSTLATSSGARQMPGLDREGSFGTALTKIDWRPISDSRGGSKQTRDGLATRVTVVWRPVTLGLGAKPPLRLTEKAPQGLTGKEP